MPPLSAKDVDRFTPPSYGDKEGAPVFLLQAPGWRMRAQFHAAAAAANLKYPTAAKVAKTVRALLEEIAPDNLPVFVGIVETFLDMDALPALEPLGAFASDDDRNAYQAEADRRAKIGTAYDELVETLRGAPALDDLVQQRAAYNLMIPPLAASYMLIGWENGPGKFRRANGVVPDDVLDMMQDDLMVVGARALEAMFVTKAQKSN